MLLSETGTAAVAGSSTQRGGGALSSQSRHQHQLQPAVPPGGHAGSFSVQHKRRCQEIISQPLRFARQRTPAYLKYLKDLKDLKDLSISSRVYAL